MVKFEGHYTGIETARIKLPKGDLYVQRNRRNGRLDLIRLSIGRKTFGAFIGYCNYLSGTGIEFFTRKIHFGFSKKPRHGWGNHHNTRHGPLEVKYSGSSMKPFESVTIRLGILCYGQRTPKWLKHMKEVENGMGLNVETEEQYMWELI